VKLYEEANALSPDFHEQLFDSKTYLGLALMETDAERAGKLFDDAVEVSSKLSSSQRVTALLNVAACATMSGRAKDGEKPAQLALDLARKTDSKTDLAYALFRRGDGTCASISTRARCRSSSRP